MEMTENMIEAIQLPGYFAEFVNNAIAEAIPVIFAEDASTANHLNRYALAKYMQNTSSNLGVPDITVYSDVKDFPSRILNNEGISFDSVQADYNTAVLNQWNNVANE